MGRYWGNFGLALLILTILLLTACSGRAQAEPKQEPQLKVTAGGQELKVIYYGDRYNETHEDINNRLKQAMEETSVDALPYIALDEEITIEAENFSTEKFAITDYILKENGEIRYQEKVAQTSELALENGTATFPLTFHPAALLSSNSEDYEPGKTLRGIIVRADIDGAPFAFAFILRTNAGSFTQEKDPGQSIADGKWELVDPNYNPVYVELADSLPVSDTYEGKTLEELWDYPLLSWHPR